MSLNRNLEYYLNKISKSFYWLGKTTDISEGIIYGIKSGKRNDITFSTAAKIAKALGISLDELYYGPNGKEK